MTTAQKTTVMSSSGGTLQHKVRKALLIAAFASISCVLSMMILTLLGGKQAGAAPAGVIDTSIPNDGLRMVVAGPSYDFGGIVSRALVYSPVNSDSFSVRFIASSSNASEISSVVVYNYNIGTETCGSTVMASDYSVTSDFTLTGSSGSTYLDPQVNRRVFCVQITARTWASDAPFRLLTAGNMLISNDVARTATKTLGTGYIYDDTPSSGDPIWSKNLYFGAPCRNHQNTFPDTVGFFDLDVGNNGAWSQGSIRIRIFDLTGGGTVLDQTIASDSPNNEELVATLNFRYSRKYRLLIQNLNGVNAIKIALPFSQIDYTKNCTITSGYPLQCSNFTGLTGLPGSYVHVQFRANNRSGFTWVASGNRYDIGVVDPSFTGWNRNNIGTTFPWNRPGGLGPPDHNSANYIRDSQNGTQNTWHRDRYNRNANDGTTPHAVERYGTNVDVANGGYRTFGVWVRVPTTNGATKDYGIRMLSRDSRFRPWAWMNWHSSCRFTVRAQLNSPTCSVLAPVVSNPRANEAFRVRTRVSNSNTSGITVNSVSYNITGSGITGSNLSGNATSTANIGASTYRDYTSNTNIRITSFGTYTISWTARTNAGNVTCTRSITIAAIRPTCSVLAHIPASPRAGEVFTVRLRAYNSNLVALSVSSASYSITGSGISGQRLSGNATSLPNIPADGQRDYASNNDIRITSVGTYTVTWTIQTNGGNRSCTRSITTTADPPTCNATTTTASVSESFTITLGLDNPNLIGLPINSVSYNIPSLGRSGNATSPSGSYPYTIPAGASRSFSATLAPVAISGSHQVNWTVTTPYGNCGDNGPLYIVDQPYYRAYGNDIVSCGTGNVLQHTPGAPVNAFNQYRGGAAQLAIFATGQIQGVLPGAMDTRGAGELHELGFSNTANVNIAGGRYGGAFSSCYAGIDYTINRDAPILTSNNLGSGAIGSGEYYSSGNVTNLNGNIPNGRRVVVYVDGNVDVRDIQYSSTSWGSLDEIPQVTVIATGNIYIHSGTTEIDGHYIAQGDIFTCAGTGSDINLTTANSNSGTRAYLINNCNNKLTINGSLKANHIHFLRINGTLADGDTFEEPTSGNIAEVIRFSPEAYLTEGGGLTPLPESNPNIDSIISRPPSF